MATRVLLVAIPDAHQADLRAGLWGEGCELEFASRAALRSALAERPPDAVMLAPEAADITEVLDADAPGTPVFEGSTARDLLEGYLTRFPAPTTLELAGGVRVDLAGRKVHHPSGTSSLTAIEARLLRFLAARGAAWSSPEHLRERVWGYAPGVRSRAVESTVYRLRKKFEADPTEPVALIAAYGAGYRLVLAETPPELPVVPRGAHPPAPRDSLVGREDDLVAVRDAFERGRLVTLLGIGGAGKTRLATAFLHRETPEDVAWIDLTPCQSEGDVLHAVSSGLGTPAPPDALADVLATRPGLLLALDNCEGCLEPVAKNVARWLDRAPTLSILATSRLPLGLRGEQRWTVGPLAVPVSDDPYDVGTSDAVRLFVDRARERAPNFALVGSEDAAQVARVVRRLDGLPLAIELAAAQAAVLPLGDLADSLLASYDSLYGDEVDRPDRHRSTDATLAWSWQGLDEWSRHGLAALTIFEGPFDWAGASAVLAGISSDPRPILQRLLDASLVGRPDPQRFGLLSLVRDFAARRLTTEDQVAARDRHAAHYATAPFDPADIAQIVAACRHAAGSGPVDQASQLLVSAWRQLRYRGPFTEIAELAVSVAERTTDPALLAEAHRIAGSSLARVGRMEEALRHHEAACAAAEATGEPRLRALTIGSLGVYHQRVGDNDKARICDLTALELGREAGLPSLVAVGASNAGSQAERVGEFAEARALFQESLDAYRTLGDKAGEAHALSRLGVLFVNSGRPDDARECWDRALAVARQSGHRAVEAEVLSHVGILTAQRGDPDGAISIVESALEIARELGDRREAARCCGRLGSFHARQGRSHRARPLLEHAIAECRQIRDRIGEGSWMVDLALVHADAGRPSAAETVLAEATAILEAPGHRERLTAVMLARARLLRDRQDWEGLQALVDEARALADELGLHARATFRDQIRELASSLGD